MPFLARLRDTEMAEPWRDRSEVSYLECILGLWRMVIILVLVLDFLMLMNKGKVDSKGLSKPLTSPSRPWPRLPAKLGSHQTPPPQTLSRLSALVREILGKFCSRGAWVLVTGSSHHN